MYKIQRFSALYIRISDLQHPQIRILPRSVTIFRLRRAHSAWYSGRDYLLCSYTLSREYEYATGIMSHEIYMSYKPSLHSTPKCRLSSQYDQPECREWFSLAVVPTNQISDRMYCFDEDLVWTENNKSMSARSGYENTDDVKIELSITLSGAGSYCCVWCPDSSRIFTFILRTHTRKDDINSWVTNSENRSMQQESPIIGGALVVLLGNFF